MDADSERLLQEALHPERRAERIWLEPDDHDPGSRGLCFKSLGSSSVQVVRLTGLDLDRLTEVLLDRWGAQAGGRGEPGSPKGVPEDAAIDRVLGMLEDEGR
jgi:hypothetical protein